MYAVFFLHCRDYLIKFRSKLIWLFFSVWFQLLFIRVL